jgi:hypothetical protein
LLRLAGLGPGAAASRIRQTRQDDPTVLPLIHNTFEHGLRNALSEATNTHLRLLTRRASGTSA